MRKLLLLICLAGGLACLAQSRYVRVTTVKGTVYEGALKEFKAFQHVIVDVEGKSVTIPYNDLAYIDDLKLIKVEYEEAKSESRPDPEAEPGLAVVPEPEPEVASEPEPEVVPEAEVVSEPEQTDVPEPEPEPEPDPVVEPVLAVVPAVVPESESAAASEPEPEPEPDPVVEPAQAVVQPVVPEPEPEPVVEPEPVAKPVEAPKPVSKWSHYKGFLLSSGNSVYLNCVSEPTNNSYNEAALDVLKRQLRRDGFWVMVDHPADAHFVINYSLKMEDSGKTTLSVSSDLIDNTEVLGSADIPEDVDGYRKIVYDLYQKHLLPLQKKIEKENVPKRTRKLFTVD